MFKQVFMIAAAAAGTPVWAAALIPVTPVTPVSCHGTGTIQATAEPSFTPAVTYDHPTRALPIPAFITFKAVVEVNFTSPGCAVLSDKYGISFGVGTTLLADVSASQGGYGESTHVWPLAKVNPGGAPVFDAHVAWLAADGAIGHVVTFQIDQGFEYAINHTLPLFPNVHEETITFNAPVVVVTHAGTVELNAAKVYQVDVESVYGIKPVGEQSDQEKLASAVKIAELAVKLGQMSDYGLPYNFDALLVNQLEPWSAAAKIQYKLILKSIFSGIALVPYKDLYFDFEVGGSGGTNIANKLIALSALPDVFKTGEAADLLYSYPGFALIAEGNNQCLVTGDGALAAMLTNATENAASLNSQQKWILKSIVGYIASSYLNITNCFPEAKEPAVKALALALQQALAVAQ